MKKNIYEKINRKKDEKSMKELRGKMTKRYVKGMGFYDFYVGRRGIFRRFPRYVINYSSWKGIIFAIIFL